MPLDRQLRTLVKDRVDRSLVGRPGRAMRVRMYVTAVATLVAVGWWGLSGGAITGRGRAMLYSPGHVSAAHARFENDCNACHAGEAGSSGFRRQVTDAACLACHDGSLHHPNQLVADSPAGVAREARVLAVHDPSRAGMIPAARSADCAGCHVEHRGTDILAALSDRHCTVCHDGLDVATAGGKTEHAAHVTAFTPDAHPRFGRWLMESGRQVDPTVLKFNHLRHLTEPSVVAALGKGEQSCVSCHAISPTDGRYAQPVKYEQHCVSCHALGVPDSLASLGGEEVAPTLAGLVAPHEPVARVNEFLAARLSRAADVDDAEFVIEDEDAPEDIAARRKWLAANWKLFAESAGQTAPQDLHQTVTVSAVADAMTEAVVRGAGGCVKCHALTEAPIATVGRAVGVETVPTNRPQGVRRWYGGSRFDHRAHRDMNCTSCHNGFSPEAVARASTDETIARSASETSFLHLPGMHWTELGADGAATARSCVDCHHADMAASRGAGARCVTCHDFHDRSLERLR